MKYFVLTIALFGTFGFAPHTSALSMSSHNMGGISHAPSGNTLNCAILCANHTFYKDPSVLAVREDDGDEPFVPFYVALRTVFKQSSDSDSKLYSIAVRPPPKVPIYILLGVFRL